MKTITTTNGNETCGNCGELVVYAEMLPGTYTDMNGSQTPNWKFKVCKYCSNCGEVVERERLEKKEVVKTCSNCGNRFNVVNMCNECAKNSVYTNWIART